MRALAASACFFCDAGRRSGWKRDWRDKKSFFRVVGSMLKGPEGGMEEEVREGKRS